MLRRNAMNDLAPALMAGQANQTNAGAAPPAQAATQTPQTNIGGIPQTPGVPMPTTSIGVPQVSQNSTASYGQQPLGIQRAPMPMNSAPQGRFGGRQNVVNAMMRLRGRR